MQKDTDLLNDFFIESARYKRTHAQKKAAFKLRLATLDADELRVVAANLFERLLIQAVVPQAPMPRESLYNIAHTLWTNELKWIRRHGRKVERKYESLKACFEATCLRYGVSPNGYENFTRWRTEHRADDLLAEKPLRLSVASIRRPRKK